MRKEGPVMEKYEEPKVEMIFFENEDVITTSNNDLFKQTNTGWEVMSQITSP